MEGTETGWGRPAEPAPRWRALLDRALTGARTGEHPPVGPAPLDGPSADRASADRPNIDPASVDRPPAGYGPPARGQANHGAPGRAPVNHGEPGHGPMGHPAPGHPVGKAQVGRAPAAPPPGFGQPPAPLAPPPHVPLAASAPVPLPPPRPVPLPPPVPAASSGEQSLGARLAAAELVTLTSMPPPPTYPEQNARGSLFVLPHPPQPPGPDGAQATASAPAAPRAPHQAQPAPYPPQEVPHQATPGAPHQPYQEAPGAPYQSYHSPQVAQVSPATQSPPGSPAIASGPPPPAYGQPRFGPAPAGPAVVSQPRAPQPAPDGRLSGYGGQFEWRQPEPNGVDDAVAILRRELGRPRVIAFANPKGGVHKTTATVLAAATIGSVRGRGVLAWDDNELRGTLGLRAGSARHARTIRHLIADLVQVEASHGEELLDRLDDYLRHASDGSYDVLAGEENPRFAQRLDKHTVRRVLELLCRTHDVICVDTGNNVESTNWQTVLQVCDQLVVTTVPREDAAFTADWMLDLLHDIGLGSLVENAVTLLSCPTPGRSPLLDDLVRHFKTRTRAVAVVPYDATLESGSSIEYPQLHAETKQAWLRAAGVMLEPFAQ